MADSNLVAQLALHCRMGDRFLNYLGNEEVIPAARKERMLAAMGYDLGSDSAIEQAIFDLDAAPWTRLLQPVYVIQEGAPAGFECHVPEPLLETLICWQLTLEGAALHREGECRPLELEETGEYWIDGVRYSRRFVPFSMQLPLGYHRVHVSQGAKAGQAPIIMAPEKSYQSDAMASGARLWGTAIQLYTLRSERNWGMGDFTDLEALIEDLSAQGADFVGLNPIHALYPISPEHASPYSPSNRNFINPLYVDVTRVPDFAQSPSLQNRVASAEFQAELASLRETREVDYARVSPLKYQCFEVLYEAFKSTELDTGSPRDQAFRDFVQERGEPLRLHAVFEALLEYFKARDINAWGWPVWPSAYQASDSPEVQAFAEVHADRVQYYLYLQFIANEQLQGVNEVAKTSGMTLGVYRDLAVGADRGGAEVWSDRARFCVDISVGAPPDALGPTGQNWGLPPYDPVALRADGYRAFINLVRNNMRGCGALRIDHAMALFRLWWCPPGADASQGVYVHYSLDDLLGILNLESQRNQCMVIAEDLGTVPDEVMTRFPQAELYSNKVFYFEASPEGVTPPDDYPAKSLAIVANHDMPTLVAYWNKSDLTLRRRLNMFPSPDDFDVEHESRDGAKQKIADALQAAAMWPEDLPAEAAAVPEMTLALSGAIHGYLAGGRAQLVAVQLEDMQLINDPVNVPGTSDEYSNWRRKLDESAGVMLERPAVQDFVRALNRARRPDSGN